MMRSEVHPRGLARPQDLVDLRTLLRVASLTELTCARNALELIVARGYHRGRLLIPESDEVVSGAS
jgi:hypothetical protein